jgi:hypothetical protein
MGARPSPIVPGEPALAGPSHDQPVELFLHVDEMVLGVKHGGEALRKLESG